MILDYLPLAKYEGVVLISPLIKYPLINESLLWERHVREVYS